MNAFVPLIEKFTIPKYPSERRRLTLKKSKAKEAAPMNKALKQSKFMQNPYVQEIIRLALPLLIITVIVAGVLGAVDAITADKIAELAVQKTQNAMGAIISGAQFEPVDFTDETGIINEVYTGLSWRPVRRHVHPRIAQRLQRCH